MKQFGSIPLGMEESALLEEQVFLYDPTNLPGLHELGETAVRDAISGGPTASVAFALNLFVDGRRYIIATHALAESDFDEVPAKN